MKFEIQFRLYIQGTSGTHALKTESSKVYFVSTGEMSGRRDHPAGWIIFTRGPAAGARRLALGWAKPRCHRRPETVAGFLAVSHGRSS